MRFLALFLSFLKPNFAKLSISTGSKPFSAFLVMLATYSWNWRSTTILFLNFWHSLCCSCLPFEIKKFFALFYFVKWIVNKNFFCIFSEYGKSNFISRQHQHWSKCYSTRKFGIWRNVDNISILCGRSWYNRHWLHWIDYKLICIIYLIS